MRYPRFLLISLLLLAGQAIQTVAPRLSLASPRLTTADVDRLISAGWKREHVTPSSPANDAEFLRRLSLDLRGRVPDPTEAAEFLAGESPNKRARKTDEMLQSEEFAGYWAGLYSQVLIGKAIADRSYGFYLFQEYLRQAFLKDKPLDRLAYEILSADGWIDRKPAVFFNYRWRDPQDLAAATARIFLGVQIRCAQCHHHPFDRWKTEDFWSYAAFYGRTAIGYSEQGEKFTDGDGSEYDRYRVYEEAEGEVDRLPSGQHPKVLPARFLAAPEPAVETQHRRRLLARWIASHQNPWFARAQVNRIWSHFMGRGFIHPVDSLTEGAKPSHPELFNRLVRDFADHGFRLKPLIRLITASRAYSLDCHTDGDRPKEELFAAAPRRRMTNQQLFLSIAQATGIEYDRKEVATLAATENSEMENPETAEDQPAESSTAESGGESPGEVAITMSETDYLYEFNVTSPIESVLLRFNSSLVSHGLLVGWQLQGVMGNIEKPEERIDWLFLCALSRYPTDGERAYFFDLLKDTPDDVESYQRLFWVLLNSTEFGYNH
ncbi:MAG: DUF1549 domain-containing protein [Planctomycetes bacterium]|nr:DUF1549 domain-containing protein [Planctomycetota bacterium]